jgi:hypothetical protein
MDNKTLFVYGVNTQQAHHNINIFNLGIANIVSLYRVMQYYGGGVGVGHTKHVDRPPEVTVVRNEQKDCIAIIKWASKGAASKFGKCV